MNLITKNPTVQIVTASKELIDALLELDTHNRKRKPSQIEYIGDQIQRNQWVLNNNGIGVSRTGYIIDGGHRLWAIKLAGYPPVQFILVTGLDEAAQPTVDNMTVRTLADKLGLLMDLSVNPYVSSILSVIWRSRNSWKGFKVPVDQVSEILVDHAEALERTAHLFKGRGKVASGFAAGLIQYYKLRPTQKTLDFIHRVATGEMIQIGTPEYVLNRATENVPCGGFAQCEALEKTIYCCEAFESGKKVRNAGRLAQWSLKPL